MSPDSRTIVSVFAGRIADAGVDPVPIMRQAKAALAGLPKAELLWASPREVLNLVQADEIGCDIITITADILAKVPTIGKDLDQFSLETVKMFYNDAKAAGFKVPRSFVFGELPKTATGKIQKYLLRARMREKGGAS